MALYKGRDIETNFDGDIELDTKGDLKLADSITTYKNAANFLLRTDYGDYAPDTTVGCNLGSFMGNLNSDVNREKMSFIVNKTLKEKVFSNTDVEAYVVPFDINEVLCVVNIGGSYLVDGIIKTIHGEVMTYTFPYMDGRYLTPITID